MKSKLTLILISLIFTLSPLRTFAANDRIFSEIADLPGVEAVYIGPAAIRLASGMLTQSIGLDGITDNIKDIKSVEVISCDNKSSFGKIKSFMDNLVKKQDLEIIVQTKEGGEATNIYGITGGGSHGSTTLSSVLIETVESDEYSLVFVRGSINLSKLMEAQ